MKTWNAEDKLSIEKELLARGCAYIAGVDEVGRGPLAGPVVCAAVIMPLDEGALIEGVDDSKKLSAKRRETLAALIKERAFAYTVYELNEKTIDEINILQATRLGMKNALLSLPIRPDAVITDGNMTLDIPFPQRSIVRGTRSPIRSGRRVSSPRYIGTLLWRNMRRRIPPTASSGIKDMARRNTSRR